MWSLERETLVLISLVLLVILFVVTGYAVKRYHAAQAALGGRWYLKGENALQANRPEEAVDDFHTALIYARDNTTYQMRLAEALVKARRQAEAGVYLRSLWVRQPGNANVNLQLARLSANARNVPEAIRYYHDAIFGVWEGGTETHRRLVRIELCKFLLGEGEKNATDSELIALQSDLPHEASLHTQVGVMFAQVEDYPHALEEFEQALKINPRQPGAAAGAGEAAYQLADYAQARRYFQRALEINPRDQEAARKLQISRLVLQLDPFQSRLSENERGRRTVEAFRQALSRLKKCAQSQGADLKLRQESGPFAGIYSRVISMQPKVTRQKLQRNPDLITNVMDLVMQMEETAEQACGTPPPPDQALLMISHTRGAIER
ncbi:MAG TPA: tetratricopeptide repeat protein [Terriglobia bacterium]|nr:tetratricopeptide repeat protein [Terriglobia bacterium]